ncbi:hypothetical protein DYB26_010550 [Aphanomyces astaci]|uniref:Uncharacterized protein n=1 Tax=Aphanomyces astaci TaxID=112090 RepID=A0A3R7AC12_APHAT|nr:hypothetical protein DYB26_010550 [Aphanomyces astaci]
MAPTGEPAGGSGTPSTPRAATTTHGNTTRDSIGSIMHEFVDSFPIDMDSRQSISDLGKVLFADGKKDSSVAPSTPYVESCFRSWSTNDLVGNRKVPYQMPKEIKGIPRQKQQDVMGITASGRVALPQGSVRKLLQTQGKAIPMRWTTEEDEMLRQAVDTHGERNWKSIAEIVPGRNHTQCLQRWTKVLAPGLIKGHWRPDEDDVLRQLVAEGRKNWGQVAARIPGRTSKQCRERWYNHLDPNIIRGSTTPSNGVAASFASPRHSLVSSFVQSLNTPLPSTEFAATHPRPAAAALNFAASFAQSQAPKDRHPPAPSALNVAASFANNRAASSTPRSDNAAADPDHKRPRLPVNMDAARAAAARRMRQGDNHADFMPPADVAPMGGDIPRISVSDINLSELGPIEEMWRVSSDMNRLSL